MRLLDWYQMKAKVPYCRQHLGRLEKRGEFPRRVQVGPGRVAWLEDEVDAWIKARASERGQQHRPGYPDENPPALAARPDA